MSENSTIEWLQRPGTKPATWNPIRAKHKTSGKIGWHCEHVHEGCTNCYAERQNKAGARGGTQLPYKPGHRKDVDIFLDEKTLLQPLRWKAPRTIFVESMSDLYGEWVSNEWLDKIKAAQALTPQHTYIELTKRPERMREYATNVEREAHWMNAVADMFEVYPWTMDRCCPIMGQRAPWIPLPNVWVLVSCSTQEDADKFIPILLDTPLAIRGVSAEPLLGPIDFRLVKVPGSDNGESHYRKSALHGAPRLDWIIIGGESGGKSARPMHPDWARPIIAQCEEAGVACFLKQWGENSPAELLDDGVDPDTPWRMEPNGSVTWGFDELRTPRAQWPKITFRRVGKKLAGRLLDGREHNGFPQART